jgi:hypothetical protein
MWREVFGGMPVSAAQVGLCMILVKCSRQIHKPKRDNLTDIAGGAKTLAMTMDRDDEQAFGVTEASAAERGNSLDHRWREAYHSHYTDEGV